MAKFSLSLSNQFRLMKSVLAPVSCMWHCSVLSAQCSAGRTRNLQLDPHPTERALRPKQLLLLSFLIFSYFGAPMSKREEVE